MSTTIDNFRKAEALLTEWGYMWLERSDFTSNAGANIETSFKGVLNHHTGAWTTSNTMLFVDGNGRTPAPLCNLAVELGGTILFGTGLYANHAGYNNKAAVLAVMAGPSLTAEIKPGPDDTNPKFSGNRYLIGIEVKSPASFNEAQYNATVALNAALVLAFGWSATNPPVGAHKEITRRKPGDPGDDMAKFRRDVVAFIAAKQGEPEPPVPEPEHKPFPLKEGQFYGPKELKSPRRISGYETKAGNPGLKAWQTVAKASGDYMGTPDGLYGKLSEKAAIRIQRKYGLDRDGLIGKDTWGAIM